jgi:uncharacterized membrane-anchored protein
VPLEAVSPDLVLKLSSRRRHHKMKGQTSKALRITLLVYAVWWVIYGLLHVVIPQTLGAKDPAIERVLGAASVAFALAAWLAYRESTWAGARIAVLVQVVWMILYTITMAWGILAGGITPDAWPPTIIGAVFAVLLAILYVRQERPGR